MFWEILKASKKLPVTDQFAALWGQKIAEDINWKVTEITGTLPLSFLSNGGVLIDYRIYGTAEGAGVETESGEPAGYKLPLMVESGEQSQDIPIYIGDSKLGEEEYVDYQEQKVYKRTENLAFVWLQNCSIGASGTISTNNVYGLAVARVESGQTYAMRIDYDSSISVAIVYAYFTEMPQIGSVSYNESRNSVTAPTQVFTAPITGYVAAWSVYGRDTIVRSATPPETYIPYLQPTDPPAPLPPIPTYKGKDTLSSTETLGEVTVKGRIKEVDS